MLVNNRTNKSKMELQEVIEQLVRLESNILGNQFENILTYTNATKVVLTIRTTGRNF